MIGFMGEGSLFLKDPHLHIWFEEVWIILDILGDNLGYGGPPPCSASAHSQSVAYYHHLFGTGMSSPIARPNDGHLMSPLVNTKCSHCP